MELIPEIEDSSKLIHIKIDTRENMRDLKLNITLSLLNAPSIKNKELVLYGQLIHYNSRLMHTNRDMAKQKCLRNNMVTVYGYE